ncbi:MAG: carboxypeptidase regulatory-like domain-containing protein [Gemmatimonadaceae bacterium]
MRISVAVATTAFLLAASVGAQGVASTGRITGRVVDAASGQGIPEASVQIVGTTLGIQSGLEGRFSVTNVPAGTVTIYVRRIGYATKTITGLVLEAGKTLEQDIALPVAQPTLEAFSVTASAERGTVNEALNAQKNSVNAVNAITAEQIAKSPDSDAAQATQRVSGITVADGKFIQARGMSERFTTASLNGARIPSPEPERKVVPLDMFPAGLLQEVTVTKTFTPDQPGDFAGASVNIKTREFPVGRQVNYSMSFGANDAVLGKSLPFAPRAGGEWAGLSNSARAIPSALANANFLGNVSQRQFNQIAQQQRNVWTAERQNGGPNGSFGISTGGNTILGRRIGYVLSGSYGYSQEARLNEHYAVGQQGADNTVIALTSVNGETGRSSAQWGGIANFSTLVGRNSRLSLNTTATRSADNEARTDRGFDENLNDSIARTTLRYIERGVVVVTAAGEHQLTARNKTAWSATYGNTSRREPDRSDVVYSRSSDGKFRLLGSLDGARRLYFNLQEDNTTAQLDHTINLGALSSQNTLKIGGYYRKTSRTAAAPIFAFLTRASSAELENRPEDIFGATQACDSCSVINVQPVGQAGSYDANDRTASGYAMADWGVGSKVRVIAGARVEGANITVNSSTQGGFTASAKLRNTDVLPSLLINTKLSENQNLRFGVTRTLARPEYRELAPVTFRDVLGGVSVTGNDQLVRSLINNYDVRYEYFPGYGEMFSVGVFGKKFADPIERVESATSGAYQARFQNAESATNYGVELEARKALSYFGNWSRGLSGFSNVTIMKSEVKLDTTKALSVTETKRRLVGQAPYVVNAGVTYASRSGASSATLLYNVVGERIFAAGVLPLPNIVEKSRDVVDFSLRFPVRGQLVARIDAKNLLDARYRFMQGNLEREGYDVGRTFAIGFSWQQ